MLRCLIPMSCGIDRDSADPPGTHEECAPLVSGGPARIAATCGATPHPSGVVPRWNGIQQFTFYRHDARLSAHWRRFARSTCGVWRPTHNDQRPLRHFATDQLAIRDPDAGRDAPVGTSDDPPVLILSVSRVSSRSSLPLSVGCSGSPVAARRRACGLRRPRTQVSPGRGSRSRTCPGSRRPRSGTCGLPTVKTGGSQVHSSSRPTTRVDRGTGSRFPVPAHHEVPSPRSRRRVGECMP